MLASIPGLELVPLHDSDQCCGSAGIYNITQPKTAAWLQRRKVRHLLATEAPIVAAANPGCHLQIQNGLRDAGAASVRVVHPVVLLAAAYRAEKKPGEKPDSESPRDSIRPPDPSTPPSSRHRP
jgi:glycolate oxidase iron-sulfur subunit